MRWAAEWVWASDEPAPRNAVIQFRRRFVIDQVPLVAKLHISADCRYFLYLNGTRLGYGPARSYHTHYEYDTYEITPYLVAQDNILAVSVAHWGESTFQHRVGRGGLLVQIDGEEQHRPLLLSDTTWRGRRSAAYRQDTPRIACQLPWEEQFDARLDSGDWIDLDFDDTAWEQTASLGPVGIVPWGTLVPRMIPFFTNELVAPVQVTQSGLVQRPEVVAAAHLTPYITPDDVSANQRAIDALLATVLTVPIAGLVTLKRCSLYGSAPRLLVDGRELILERDPVADVSATCWLTSGSHVLLLDWQGVASDLDITLTASGIAGMTLRSPLPGEDAGVWAITCAPERSVRIAACAANTRGALLTCGAVWQSVRAIDTPSADVYMDITASRPLLSDPPHTTAERALFSRVAEQGTTFPFTVGSPMEPSQAAHFVVDFGREVIGWLTFEVEAPAGAILDVLGYEGVQGDHPVYTEQMNNTLRYTCREGRQRYTSLLRRGFRYLLLAVHGTAVPVTIHQLDIQLATYPGPQRGAFSCSDTRLTHIWDLCAYTLRLCSEDTFTDCPAYEQTLWTGDLYTDALLHGVVHGDPRLVERCLRLIAHSLERLPLVNAQVPGDWENDPIPNWSALWVLSCREHYWYTGDLDFVRDLYPALAQQGRYFVDTRNAWGLVAPRAVWHFLDWIPIEGTPQDSETPHVLTHESCFAVAALLAMAEMAQAIGHHEEATQWRQMAIEVTDAVNRRCWSPEAQAYVDSVQMDGTPREHFSQPTNIIALVTGVATGDRVETLRRALAAPPAHWIPTGSPWMFSFHLQHLARQGAITEMLHLIRLRWGEMLAKGATTAWETFIGWMPQGLWTRSWCHAWSALPAYLLSAYLLGVRPLAPGYTQVLIAPQFGDLSWMRGTVPTPLGDISVHLEREESQASLVVNLPAGMSAQVRLPEWEAQRLMPEVNREDSQVVWTASSWVIALPAVAHATRNTVRWVTSTKAQQGNEDRHEEKAEEHPISVPTPIRDNLT
ncbi:MAG TPA: family 78 glycoside hydrolase catalytic domain [Ktedonobacterales bacterium]|nr:family 78 glycoside hydrolase catalytic domain [Ktedonobacterales bacterium]